MTERREKMIKTILSNQEKSFKIRSFVGKQNKQLATPRLLGKEGPGLLPSGYYRIKVK